MKEKPAARSEPDRAFEALLDYLKRERGFDFSGYKQTGLQRRVRKRMGEVGVDDFAGYLDYLQANADEFARLFDTLLINVTGFFRDGEAWRALREEFIPRLLADKPEGEPIRVWSAGCSSGQEAYTLVMALAEALGWEQFKRRVKVYATDVDEHALAQARAATYTARDLENVPEPLRERYFEEVGGQWVFRGELRRFVIFGRNDLSRDAPISHLDLLVCRNALMYFNAEAQGRILARLHFALRDTGVLFLGKAEMLLTRSSLFTPLDLKNRIFAKVPRSSTRERLMLLAQASRPLPPGDGADGEDAQLCVAALDAVSAPQIVIDGQARLKLVNEAARSLFRLSARDVGRPFRDLEVSYRPVELRSRIDQAHAEGRPVYISDVKFEVPGGALHHLDVQVVPLTADGSGRGGASVTFTDVTRYRRMKAELQAANESLETAYEELQATNEELETTNEELQSTIEELETTNEELHSTNEELETMNEELQSTNEELETMNDELRRRTEELNRVDRYMDSVLSAMPMGMVAVNGDLCVQLWNQEAEELWGVRADEVHDRTLPELDIGLPIDPLRPLVRACLSGASQRETATVPARNRRGRAFECRVECTPLQHGEGEIWGALLLMSAPDALAQ